MILRTARDVRAGMRSTYGRRPTRKTIDRFPEFWKLLIKKVVFVRALHPGSIGKTLLASAPNVCLKISPKIFVL